MPPLVSVIIPTYCRAALLKRAIDSVLAQGFSDYEILIVDDGSTDNTAQVVQSYLEGSQLCSDRIRYLCQENQGKSVALNYALDNAQGEWIAFLDDDDAWHPEKLEWQVKAIRQFGDRCGACFTNARFTNNPHMQKTTFEIAGHHFEQTMGIVSGPANFIYDCTVWTQTLMARTEVIRRIGGFDPKLRFGEDADIAYRLSLVTDFCFVNMVLVDIDRTPASQRHVGPNEIWDKVEFRLQQGQYRYEKWLRLSADMPSDLRKSIRKQLRSTHSAWTNWYLRNKRYEEARQAISEAARCHLTPQIAVKWVLVRLSPNLARSIIVRREEERLRKTYGIAW